MSAEERRIEMEESYADAGEPAFPKAESESAPLSDTNIAEAPLPDSPIEEVRREIAEQAVEQHERTARREPQRPADFRPARQSQVTEAIEDVNRIMSSLRQVLEQLEEILETLELAEVQKNSDEREIDSLRRALRNLERGPIPSSQRQEQISRGTGRRDEPRRDDRRDRDDQRRGDHRRGDHRRHEQRRRDEPRPAEPREPQSREREPEPREIESSEPGSRESESRHDDY